MRGATGGVQSEHVRMSDEDKEKRIERAVRALRAGVLQRDLIERGFRHEEIAEAARRAKR